MNKFLDYFEVVWQKVNNKYFDPTQLLQGIDSQLTAAIIHLKTG
jgi:hypothetical protein